METDFESGCVLKLLADELGRNQILKSVHQALPISFFK